MDRRRAGGSLADLRRANRDEAVRLLRLHGSMTQAQLARLSGLSHASVSNIVRDLTQEGTARVETQQHNGRRSAQVTLNPDSGLVVGVDFGNRHVRVAVADMLHNVLAEEYATLPHGHRSAESVQRALRIIAELVASGGRRMDEIKGMTVGLPGPIVEGSNRLGSPNILPGWADVDVAESFRKELRVPVVVDNDANLGAVAESLWGRGREVRNFAYLKLSTGIGAGLVIDGHLYRGSGGMAGEIGHTTIDEDGPLCRCGNRGCLETMAAAPALVSLLQGSHGPEFSLEDLLRLGAQGDIGCRRVIADAGRHIGVAVANLCNLLNPELIIVGGELALAGDVLLSAITDSLSRRAMSGAAQGTEVVTGALAERTAVLGAIAMALHDTESGGDGVRPRLVPVGSAAAR
ncbi:MAG: ROK family transcriptional regulator [Candidatus Dormibacteraeota bacterium]|nr:ROK family transcriptional regulator [Candidatus Dormibacteraeota bacterium]MBV8444434.1 ROK family transcriptional regulator [Candidatus Dormibacteraeota bacterium]